MGYTRSPRGPGRYDRRERRDVWLSIVNEPFLVAARAAREANAVLGYDAVRVTRFAVGNWDFTRVDYGVNAMLLSVYVSTQDKLRPRDVKRIIEIYERERGKMCCVSEELTVIVYRGATATAERMLREWAYGDEARRRTRLLVKADVMEGGGRLEALSRIRGRIRRFVEARLRGVLKELREMAAAGARSVGTVFARVVALVSALACRLGIVARPDALREELMYAYRYAPSDTGPPPRRLLEILGYYAATG